MSRRDVYRAGDGSYHVEADLPGVGPDSVEVTVEHSTLDDPGRTHPHYGESEQVIVAEQPRGRSPASCPSARAWTRRTSPPATPTVSCT
jgi:hypothetical protein